MHFLLLVYKIIGFLRDHIKVLKSHEINNIILREPFLGNVL